MPIYKDSQKIAALYKGSTAIARVYKGSVLVFEKESGGGEGPTSTQWRVLFPTGNSTAAFTNFGFVSVQEARMRATPGGPNLCTGGAASASSFNDASRAPAQAFDGLITGFPWATAQNQTYGSWLQYTFASPVSINELEVVCSIPGERPTTIRLQYWDGVAWVTRLADESGAIVWSSNVATLTYIAPYVEPTGYPRWRLYFDTGSLASVMEIREVEMRSTPGGADRCFGGTAVVPNSLAGNAATIFNNISTSSWAPSAPQNGTGLWVEFNFYRPEQITQVTIQCGPANTGPRQTSLQYFDGSNWVTDWQAPAAPTWANLEIKTFTKP